MAEVKKLSDGKVASSASSKSWSPNETQKSFIETLKDFPDGVTLTDIAIDTGKQFKTGSINTLVSKGLVKTADGERVSDIVYRGVVIGKKTDPVKVYRLA